MMIEASMVVHCIATRRFLDTHILIDLSSKYPAPERVVLSHLRGTSLHPTVSSLDRANQ